jgi:hypothetical protein
MDTTYTIAALLYGDYPELASRLLYSLPTGDSRIKEVRLGLNEVSEATLQIVRQWAAGLVAQRTVVNVLTWRTDKNTGKYRVMREMLHSQVVPFVSKYVMWFDDDSFVTSSGPADVAGWLDRLGSLLASDSVVQVGRVHRIRQRGVQYCYVRNADWYTGLQIDAHHKFLFATGGWWVADYSFLRTHDYPFADMYHNGGDSMLGELVRQQDKLVVDWKAGASCGCESCAVRGNNAGVSDTRVVINQGGRGGRRGIGVTGEHYVGSSERAPIFPESRVYFDGFWIRT